MTATQISNNVATAAKFLRQAEAALTTARRHMEAAGLDFEAMRIEHVGDLLEVLRASAEGR